MNLRWLAAILCPYDIAPHPNFMSSATIDQPGLLAMLASARLADYARVTGSLSILIPSERTVEAYGVVDDVSQALMQYPLTSDSSLARLEQRLATEIEDICELTAGAIFAAALFGDLDRNDSAIRVLTATLNRLKSESASSTRSFCTASLLQQRARREWDLGRNSGLMDSVESFQLASTSQFELPQFEVSANLPWDCRQTIADMTTAVLNAADLHRRATSDSATIHSGQVRELNRPSLRADRRAAIGYSAHESALFREAAGSNSAFGGTEAPGFEDIFSSLLFHELVGSPECVVWRRRLGVHLFIESVRIGDEAVAERISALRLLRRGEDKKRLQSAVSQTRTHGPLTALRDEVRSIATNRAQVGQLRLVELAVLADGGTLLEGAEARQLLSVLRERTHVRLIQLGSSWTAESVVQELVWSAAVSVAKPAGEVGQVLDDLLHVVGASPTADELFDRSWSRVLRSIDWSQLANDVRQRWRTWLTDESKGALPGVAEALRPHLVGRLIAPVEESQLSGGATTLDRVAAWVNEALTGSSWSFPSDLWSDARELTIAEMRRIQSEAEQGRGSLGAPQPCELAVALCQVQPADEELWNAIVDFLVHPLVFRNDKDAAFERIARFPNIVPTDQVMHLTSASSGLLDESFDVFSDSIVPYPPALRALATTGAISADEALGQVARLSGTNDSLARVEAARTVTSIARLSGPPAWTFVLSVQLSLDAEVGARAEAGRALALLWPKFPAQQTQIQMQLEKLLGSDSVMVPLLLIRGLQEVPSDLPDFLRSKLTDLSLSHPDYELRVLAERLVRGG